jgi:hypothetical protein
VAEEEVTVGSARTTYVLAGLAVLATGWVFFFETTLETTEERRALENRVLRITADEVARIEIKRDHWTSALLERTGAATDFRLVEPAAAAADAEDVGRMLSALEFLESRSRIEGAGNDQGRLYELGLDPPRLEIGLADTNGREVQIAFGKEPVAGGGVYLRVLGEGSVHVVDAGVLETFDRYLDRAAGIEKERSGEGG